ncbi:MAG: glycosyltransferase family 4 protein, partial [Proteobacteria bacterium]|nr:glycosyltransferase family 4 protein [Pseudomonadota bacterium]
MKIAIVVKEHIETKGGLERYAVTLSRGLTARGHEVHVYANRWDVDESLIFHYVPCVKWLNLLKVITFPANARKHLAKSSFDLVYSLTPLYPVDIYRVGEGIHADVLRARFPNPLKRFLKRLTPKHRSILAIEKRLFTKGNYRAIITNSKLVKERLNQVYDVPFQDIEVIYNGYDDKLFNTNTRAYRGNLRDTYGIGDKEKVLLFASNDFKRKGLVYLLEAIAFLNRRDIRVRLMVVGKGKTAQYKRIAERLGILSQVIFAGAVTDIERY